MLNLIFAIICSTSIALILKLNDNKSGNAILLLAGNYFIAALISLTLFFIDNQSSYSLNAVMFGMFLGLIFLSSFFAFSKAVNIAGTALATVSSRISVVVPVFLSILVFNELPTLKNIIGLILTLLTILLFYLSLKYNSGRKLKGADFFILLGVLIGVGLADFSMKIFEELFSGSEKNFFLFSVFGSAFIYSLMIFYFKKQKFEKRTFLTGGILGIPNMLSSFFLIGALVQLPAIIVYPVANIGIIIFTAVAAFAIWKESLNRIGFAALLAGLLSIFFLSYK